jgi:hypothetical protein
MFQVIQVIISIKLIIIKLHQILENGSSMPRMGERAYEELSEQRPEEISNLEII